MRSSARRLATWLGAALVLGACGDAPPPEEIPLPSLAHVDPEVVDAIEAARELVANEPASADAWGGLGDRYFVHAFPADAARCYAKAEALDPERAAWPYRLGWSLVNEAPEEAIAPFERSLRTLGSYAPAHAALALVLVRAGRPDEAFQHYLRASELDPRAPGPETGLGQILLARGDLTEARVHLEEALERDPKHVEAHVALAQVLLAVGEEEEARRHAELSRTLPPGSRQVDPFATPSVAPAGARMRTQAGGEFQRQGKLAEAEEQYRLALATNPRYYTARWSLSRLLVKQGRREEALELLREAERMDPTFEQVRRDLAKLERAGDASALEDPDE
jgi:tetratricopeptide (TPR) repeat protein